MTTSLPPETLIKLLRKMVLIRRFEEKIIDVYSDQDMKTPVHLYIGEEAIASAVCINLKKEDYIFTTHRSHGHCLAKGMAPEILLAEFYGKKTGCCKGKGGSMHPADPDIGILGTSAIVGGGIALAVGSALASKMRKDNRVSVPFFGDGAVDEGIFHESLNFASLKKLPVVFVCENNFYSVNSHQSARHPQDNIAKRADGYNMEGIQLDGNDVLGIYHATQQAVQKARSGGGPTLLECRAYRWKGHVGPDCDYEKGCRPKKELETWMDQCPLAVYKGDLIENQVIREEEYQNMLNEIDTELDAAFKFGKESPFPNPEELCDHLYYSKE